MYGSSEGRVIKLDDNNAEMTRLNCVKKCKEYNCGNSLTSENSVKTAH